MTEESVIDRVVGCLLGMAVGDAMGQASDGMTAYQVMKEYRYIDGFFKRKDSPGSSGRIGCSTQFSFMTLRWIMNSRFKLDVSSFSEMHVKTLSKSRGWDEHTVNCVKKMASGTPYENCGEKSFNPTFISKCIVVGIISGVRNVDDEAMYKAVTKIAKGTNIGTLSVLSAFVLACVIRESIRSYESISTPLELYDGPESLCERIRRACLVKEKEMDPSDLEYDRMSDRIRYVIRNLQKGKTIREFMSCNGWENCLEVSSLVLFSFMTAPEDFKALSEIASMGRNAALCSSLTGALIGAYAGLSFLPKNMKEGLESALLIEQEAKEFASFLIAKEEKTDGSSN
jgi:ADP-ribosylglycohydrolase